MRTSIWRTLLTPRWILTSLLVLVAAAVLVRLGIWQLDRLAQRRVINAQYALAMSQPPLDLNQAAGAGVDLSQMTYRDAVVTGAYDFDGEVLLLNQVWENTPGYHLLTPLVIAGTDQAILVDRGWIPLSATDRDPRAGYGIDLNKAEAGGKVTLSGRLMPSEPQSGLGAPKDPPLEPGEAQRLRWNRVSLERIGQQVDGELLPLYLIAAPEAQNQGTKRALPEIDLSEGSHLSYAIQWFIFASILVTGYPFYVRKQLHKPTPRA